ncbi:MAG: Arc family DNA-binding protein [Actinomycetota bacterium]|nr:Arc family DNA-binding protein [Actinomycetota bacterium]
MPERKSFLLRISSQTLKELEKWAADELRSVNAQIEYVLVDALKKAGRMRDPKKD